MASVVHNESSPLHSSPLFSTDLIIEDVKLSPFLTSPHSQKKLFLAGAGVRSIQINPALSIKVTCLAFYLEEAILPLLAHKWSGKSATELASDDDFFNDIITAPVEKFSRVTMLKPLPGPEFTKKVMENTTQVLVRGNAFGEEEEKAVEEFHSLFKDKHLVPGTGPHYLFTSSGLGVGFDDQDEFTTEITSTVGTKVFGEALLSTMIGKDSVSPASKLSLAERLSTLF